MPAACLPTHGGAERQDAGKPQGPSGPNGMGGDTAAAARQNVDEADASGEAMGEDVGVMTRRVTFSTPGLVPAACLPTHGGAERQDAGKLPGPSGLKEAGTRHCPSRDIHENSTMTIDELIAKINLTEKRQEGHDEEQMNCIMAVLGADPRSFKREKRQAVKRLVSEIYSPPRVTDMLRHMSNHGLTPGLALDLTTFDPDDGQPWDFSVKAKREKVLKMTRAQKPLFVIGSPPCTRWCTWQKLNDAKRDPEVVKLEQGRAEVHLKFATQIYREQIEGGRFFLHEHPDHAGS